MRYLITNASVVNEGCIVKADVLIENGLISDIVSDGIYDASGAYIIDAAGRYLIPGIIDEHVHFREPGMTRKADIGTESRAAVAGGVTSFMDMPNTIPQTVTCQLLEEKFALASQKSLANYSFYIGATNGNLDEVLGIDPGKVCGIKLFMGSSTGDMLMDDKGSLEALFREAPCLIAAHCEDESTIKAATERFRTMVSDGKAASDAALHPLIRSAEACFRSTESAVDLAEKTGARLHVMHISTEKELALFRSGMAVEEKKITAETCPHYLLLQESDYEELGFAMKCNPAVKSSVDRNALKEALRRGLIDTIGTDHAPHLREEKFTGDYFTSKSGFPSVQHGFELMYGLVEEGCLSMTELVTLMCHNPARLYGIDRRGFIRKGYHADLAIIDPTACKTLSDEGEFSKCGWTPYAGRRVSAGVTHTFVNGNLVYENGDFHDGFRGERLKFNR